MHLMKVLHIESKASCWCTTALNFFLMVVDNMRPAVESVRYLVFICSKILFLQILDI